MTIDLGKPQVNELGFTWRPLFVLAESQFAGLPEGETAWQVTDPKGCEFYLITREQDVLVEETDLAVFLQKHHSRFVQMAAGVINDVLTLLLGHMSGKGIRKQECVNSVANLKGVSKQLKQLIERGGKH